MIVAFLHSALLFVSRGATEREEKSERRGYPGEEWRVKREGEVEKNPSL